MFNIFMFFKNCNYVYMLISMIRSCHTIAYERKYEYRKPCMHTSAYSKIFKHAYLAVYMHPYATVCRPCLNLKRIQPMPNVPLAYVSLISLYMIEIFYTLAYANTIRNSVTGPYGSPIFNWIETLRFRTATRRQRLPIQ
jgi:hypothetical protein